MKKVVHFEIPADDIARAKQFYSETFGWGVQEWEMKDGSIYVGARTVPVDEKTYTPKEPGAINGGIVKRDDYVKTPVITINVTSIDEHLKLIEENGGKIIKQKDAVEDAHHGVIGYYAYFIDTEGNIISLWEEVDIE